MAKSFKSIEQQIELLKERGLIIQNEDYAYKVLSQISYYRLSGYTLTLRENDIFYKNITLEQVINIYHFDAELRSILLYFLEYIEVEFRAYFGYYHSKKYGPLGYKEEINFQNKKYFEGFMYNVERCIEENKKNELYIEHYNKKYNGEFPCWVIVELLSFGCLSKGFSNLPIEVKKEICKIHFNNIPYHYIEGWLHGLVVLRNICAHRGRLYNRLLTVSAKLDRKDKELFQSKDINKSVKYVFVYIFIMFKLIENDQIKLAYVDKLSNLINQYPSMKLKHYGFPENWNDILSK